VTLNQPFLDEHHVEAFIFYLSWPVTHEVKSHKYLVWWRRSSTEDESWVMGSMFAPILHPYMEFLQKKYGAENICFSPEEFIWVLL
jgi:hypothetical protein